MSFQSNFWKHWTVWVFPVLLISSIIYLLYSLTKKEQKFDFDRLKTLGVIILFILPLNFVTFSFFESDLLTFSGNVTAPVIPLLALVPVVVTVGLSGPIAAVLIGFLTGFLQYFLHKQDPMLGLVYASIAVTFAWLTSRSLDYESPHSFRKNVENLLRSYLIAIPVITILQFTYALNFDLRDAMEVLQQIVTIFICQTPGILFSIAVLLGIFMWLPKLWRPADYLRLNTDKMPYKHISEQIEILAHGNYDREVEIKAKTDAEKNLYRALEKLRKNLHARNDAQSRLLSLDPSHYSREGYDLVLSSILRAALTREASSARLVLIDQKDEISKPEMRLRLGQGEQTRVYAFLDVLILEKIGDQDQLILTDLKIDQYFGLNPGNPYPQSIAALQLKNRGNKQGLLWVGFEKNHWFNQEDINFYQQLAYRASAAISTKEQIAEVQKEKDWLSSALNAIVDPMFLIDKEGFVTFLNTKAKELSQDANLLSTNPNGKRQIVHPELLKIAQGSEPLINKDVITLGNKDFEISILPVQSVEQIIGKAIVLQDNSWKKQVNQQKTEFVTNISHDLRSPLKLMKGYIRLLTNIGNLNEEQKKYVTRIENGIENMSRLVTKVLSLERLDTDEVVIYNTFDMREMIDETINMLTIQAQQRKVSLHTDFGGMKTPNISADRVLLQQAMFNLIENAIKFSPRGGAVLITAEKDRSWIHIAIKDQGQGIAPLDQPKIFNRFFHVEDSTNYEDRGQGLGLAIVKSIAEKHGGTVSVQSQLGEGSTFYLDIPLHRL